MKMFVKGCTVLGLAVAILAQPAMAQDTNSPGPTENWRPVSAQAIQDRVAIEALCIEYFYRLDHQLAAKLPELFEPDGLMIMADGLELRGREAIAEFYAARPATTITRHVSTNLRIQMLGPDHARILRTFTYYRGEEPVGDVLPTARPAVAEYEEEVRRGKDGLWRFSYRHPVSIFDPHR